MEGDIRSRAAVRLACQLLAATWQTTREFKVLAGGNQHALQKISPLSFFSCDPIPSLKLESEPAV